MMEKPQTTNHNNNKQRKKKKTSDPNTLFVKFTPPSPYITRHHLSNYFSNWGPVNKCSVIRNKAIAGNNKAQEEGDGGEDKTENQGDRGTKGYGFVRFVNVDDAISAAQAIKEQNSNSQLKKGMTVDGILYKIHAERAVDAVGNNTNNVQKKKENISKDTDKKKEENNKVTPPPSSNKTSTTPTISKEEEQTKYKTESKRKRTSRVIIRNLSFYANQSNIIQVMETLFGPVSVVDLPLVPNTSRGVDDNNNNNTSRGALSRHRGFAFVTFTNLNAAKMAVEYDKEVRIKNRVVAVDFSISKVEHQRLLKEEKDKSKSKEESSDSSDGSSSSESEEESDGEESNSNSSSDDGDDSSSSSEEESDSDSDSEDEKASDDDKKDVEQDTEEDADKPPPEDQFTTSNESKRTLFLRNIPFDATRHDVFELFRKFGRIEGVYLVKDKVTGVFKGTAFVRFENEEGCMNAMDEATGGGGGGGQNEDGTSQFVSSKNMTMSGESESSSLTLKGRTILLDLAVDRTTASSLAIQRDEDGKPIKKMVGKDKRNLYLKNEGRVSSSTDSGHAQEASAKHGGLWEDLPMSDRAKRERAFADKSTKLRSPLFFINPNRISIRNLNKEVNESQLKSLVFGALKLGIEEGLVTPKDAVSHWRAGGELPHAEVMRRATDPKLVTPPIDEKNMKESVVSVFIDRDVSGGKKTADAPSRGFGFVEFTHHTHALAVLRQLNNNPMYSREYVAGGKHAGEMSKQKRKKGKGKKNIDNTGDEFMNDDGKGLVSRLIVEFAVENKVKARQQAEKVAQKKANKIKQRIEKKEKQQEQKASDDKKEKKKGRGALQREKKRKRKEAGEDNDKAKADEDTALKKKQKLASDKNIEVTKEKKQKLVKPKKKRKIDKREEDLEDMIRSYKSTFSQGGELGKGNLAGESKASEPKTKSREEVVKKRWFE